mgnify:FL=1
MRTVLIAVLAFMLGAILNMEGDLMTPWRIVAQDAPLLTPEEIQALEEEAMRQAKPKEWEI